MKILFLAPQPFFQERGTPIAVRLALEVLAVRNRDRVDLLTYHEGTDLPIVSVKHHRIRAPKWLRGIGPGISWKKLLCDVIFTFKAFGLVWRNRREQYQLIHAVEESVFIAFFIKLLFRIPYIYDMDSSLALQLADKWRFLQPLRPLLELCERAAVRRSLAVVPVCDALAIIADRHGSSDTHVLHDISLVRESDYREDTYHLRNESKARENELIALYIGNLERYQGVDLFVESIALVRPRFSTLRAVIIGGSAEHIEALREKCTALGIIDQVSLLGTRPVESLSTYLLQADILVSPRLLGNNTPMKIYSYLHAGRAVAATRLPTHTQVLNDEVAALADPTPENFAEILLTLAHDAGLRRKLGERARALAEERYTYPIFSARLNELYDRVAQKLNFARAA